MSEEWDNATVVEAPRQRNGRSAFRAPRSALADRLPPHSIEAEMGLIGCVLLGGRDTFLEALESITSTADFYDLKHQVIWQALLDMDVANKPIHDINIVRQTLKDANQLEECGGPVYLDDLQDATPAAAHLPYYVPIVVEKARLRRMIVVCTNIIGRAFDEQANVPAILEDAERDVLGVCDTAETSPVLLMKERVLGALKTIETSFEHRNQGLCEMGTQFGYLDKKTTGLHAGQLWLVGGRPGTGKTSLAVTMMLNMALRAKVKVGFLSMEMSAEEITLRMLCGLARASMMQVHSGMVSQRDLVALTKASMDLETAPIYIDDTPALTPQGLRVHGRRLVSRYGCQVLFIDHLHEVSDPIHRGDEQRDAKAAVTAARWLARVLHIPVVALAQLSREFEKDKGNRKPRMSDLRGHGANEQMAHFIGILHRDKEREKENNADYSEDTPSDVWLNTLEVCKQRNGPTGPVHFVFHRPSMRYEDATMNTGNRVDGERKQREQTQDEL